MNARIVMDKTQQSSLKELISKGKEQGYLTYAEVNDHLPTEIVDPEQVEEIIAMIVDMGISVSEVAPDDDEISISDKASNADEANLAELPILCACTCARWAR